MDVYIRASETMWSVTPLGIFRRIEVPHRNNIRDLVNKAKATDMLIDRESECQRQV
jgi:hypothetical protein